MAYFMVTKNRILRFLSDKTELSLENELIEVSARNS